MVYKKRNNYRRSRRYAPKTSSRQIMRVINKMSETKIHQPNENAVAISTSGYLVSLTSMSQGTGSGNRIGDKIYVDRFIMRFLVENSDPTNLVRVVIARALKSDPSLSDFPTTNDLQPIDPQKWFVYYDHVFNPKDTETGTDQYNETKIFRQVVRKVRAQSKYDGSTSLHGGLYMFVRSDSGAIGHPFISWHADVYYKDI